MVCDAHDMEPTTKHMSRINGKEGNNYGLNGTRTNQTENRSMTEEIPTGEATTVPASELEELVDEWNDAHPSDNTRYCAKQLQAIIDKHDPKQDNGN